MNLLQAFFSGPLLLPTVTLLSVSAWGLLATLFSFDSHSGSVMDHAGSDVPLGHGGLDHSSGGPASIEHSGSSGGRGVGNQSHEGLFAAISQWLNIREMPLMFWFSVFAVLWWIISAAWWLIVDRWLLESPGIFWSFLLMARNLICTLPCTKIATIPLKGWESSTHFDARSLIGKECEISSTEAGPAFGQVKFKTQGAPLLLDVRTDGPYLARGARVWITHYDEKKRIYQVSPIDPPKIQGQSSNSN